MTKKNIINELINHYCGGDNREFAKKLSIAPTTLSSWKARDSFDYDAIYANCEDLNPEWLLSGGVIGEMINTKTPPAEAEGVKKVEANDGSKSYALNLKNILAEQKLTSLRLHDIEGLLTLLNQSVGRIQAQLSADNTDNNPGGAQGQHQKPRKAVKSR